MAGDQTNAVSSDSSFPRRILVVNDNDDALFLLGYSLRQALPGAEIMTALNARDALTVWKRGVDAIVTDDRMPEITGIELTREIRTTDATIPIVMVTGTERNEAEAMKAGVTVFCADGDYDSVASALCKCFAGARSRSGSGTIQP